MLYDYFLAINSANANVGTAAASADDIEFVRQMLEWTEKELDWWLQERSVKISPLRRTSRYDPLAFSPQQYTMFRYHV
jgi:hypothetical protein